MSPYMGGMRPADNPEGDGSMLSESRKAILGFLLAVLTPLGVLLSSGEELTVRNVVASVVAGAIVGLGVYLVPNAPRPPVDPGV